MPDPGTDAPAWTEQPEDLIDDRFGPRPASEIAAWADESGIAPQLLDALLARLTPEAREAALIDGGWVAQPIMRTPECDDVAVYHPDHQYVFPESRTGWDEGLPDDHWVPLYRFTTKGASDGN